MNTLLQILLQGLLLGGIYALIALALAIVYSVTHQLNFAHGDLISISMYLALFGATAFKCDPYVSILIISPIMFGLGLLLFRGLFGPMLNAPLLVVVQVTLALSFVVQSALLIVFSSNFQSVQSILSGTNLSIGPVTVSAPPLLAFAAATVLAGLCFWVITRTHFGRTVLAVAEDAEAASLCGVKVLRVQTLVFAGALGVLGIVGPLLAPILILQPTVGLHLTLISFIVFILGGTSNYLGTFIAGIIIGISESVAALYMQPPELAAAVPYLIFMIFLLVRPQGISRA